MSSVVSTAAMDKSPQSQQRGITLDLGFSALQVALPERLAGLPYDRMQFTLVDCPGHASLIRTIIGGAQIMDMMLLLVDATKGFQTQTAECLVVGEISPTQDMLVVLNKIDLLPQATRATQIEKMSKRLRATLRGTKFVNAAIVPVCAAPAASSSSPAGREGIDQLVQHLTALVTGDVRRRRRDTESPFLFAVDHCFPIRGQGSVMTGTVLQGTVGVGHTIELPALKLQRKVKSMQMFRRAVTSASQGDRVGICVAQLDTSLLERGLAAAPGSVGSMRAAVACVSRVRFFSATIASKSRFHVTVGHTTVMADLLFFSHISVEEAVQPADEALPLQFDYSQDYRYEDELGPAATPATPDSSACRLAFHGRIAAALDPASAHALQSLRIYKVKTREGFIERFSDPGTAICKGLFKKEADMSHFIGLRVTAAQGSVGIITSSFGKSGKFKVVFPVEAQAAIAGAADKRIVLQFKRYIHDPAKHMVQDK
eukprot:jgi/Mesen1/1155/ME000124S00193